MDINNIIDNISTSLECTILDTNNTNDTSEIIKQNNEKLNKILPHVFTIGTTSTQKKKCEKIKKKKSQSKYKFKDKNEFVKELKFLLKIPLQIKTDNKIIMWMHEQSKYLKKMNDEKNELSKQEDENIKQKI